LWQGSWLEKQRNRCIFKEWSETHSKSSPGLGELANFKPQYNFVVRQYAIGKGHSVSVLWRGGEVVSVFGFASEYDALEWIKTKSQGWLLENKDKAAK
jgi:hypothetical protein